MNQTIDLLKFIYQNGEMGLETLNELNGILKDNAIRQVIEAQMLEYKSILSQAKRKLEAIDEEAKGSVLLKTSAKMMINMKTMTDRSADNAASMIIQGSTRGVIQITRKLKDYVDADDDVKNIGYKLLWIEQKNIDHMKHFL